LIRLEEIAYAYPEGDRPALLECDLEVAAGEKLVLLGSNGSGKSTLLRILAALYRPQRGRYLLEGRPVDFARPGREFRREVAILFQNPESMIFNPTVYEEIAFGLREFGLTEEIDGRVRAVAGRFGIASLLERNPIELSGGEKQKVILAALLALEPRLLLLDEPTASMDPRTTGWLIDLLLDLEQTVIVATHDLSLAYEIAERAVVLGEEHRILFDGPMEELLADRELLIRANLIHRHRHRHKGFHHSHYHTHFQKENDHV
jgi:cobalt/nickel transport system ATP-binding protein